jgi:hypothetical protein
MPMTCQRQITEHLERALVETLLAMAEFDHLRAQAGAQGEKSRQDSLSGMLLMLQSALESAIALTRDAAPAQGDADYSLAAPDSRR